MDEKHIRNEKGQCRKGGLYQHSLTLALFQRPRAVEGGFHRS